MGSLWSVLGAETPSSGGVMAGLSSCELTQLTSPGPQMKATKSVKVGSWSTLANRAAVITLQGP